MYSSIHNLNSSLLYTIRLNDSEIATQVPSTHIDSFIYQLESEGHNIDGVYWNEDELIVELTSFEEETCDYCGDPSVGSTCFECEEEESIWR